MEQASPPHLTNTGTYCLEQQWEYFPKEMKLQWITVMNSLGQQLILWRTVLKMFFFSVNEILSCQRALMNELRWIWPISGARWICFFPGNKAWGLESWSMSQGTYEAFWSRQTHKAASGWCGFRRVEPPAPCAARVIRTTRCNKYLLI